MVKEVEKHFWHNAYKSRIGLNNQRLTLSLYKDIYKAAAAHNISAVFLYGEYAGYMNDVQIPSADFVTHVEEKCRRFKERIGV